ncbi:MAG: hypothetical protein AVDCRST_MAG20-243, partial [uncultured Acidimicrobiales bacterium]
WAGGSGSRVSSRSCCRRRTTWSCGSRRSRSSPRWRCARTHATTSSSSTPSRRSSSSPAARSGRPCRGPARPSTPSPASWSPSGSAWTAAPGCRCPTTISPRRCAGCTAPWHAPAWSSRRSASPWIGPGRRSTTTSSWLRCRARSARSSARCTTTASARSTDSAPRNGGSTANPMTATGWWQRGPSDGSTSRAAASARWSGISRSSRAASPPTSRRSTPSCCSCCGASTAPGSRPGAGARPGSRRCAGTARHTLRCCARGAVAT